MPRPPVNTLPKPTLRERLAALGNLPRFFKLVWETNHWYTILDAVLRLIRSAIPVSILYIGKLIIDEVILLSNVHSTNYTYLWELVAAEFLLAIISDALSRATSLVDSLLGDLFSNHTSVKIMEHAATLDLDQFEDSEFYDKLERARQQTIGRTILLSQILNMRASKFHQAFFPI
jgi:ATP-binding cassette subfamily B protein